MKYRVRPKKHLYGRKLKSVYRALNNGFLPADWTNRPSVEVRAEELSAAINRVCAQTHSNYYRDPFFTIRR